MHTNTSFHAEAVLKAALTAIAGLYMLSENGTMR